MALGAEDVGSYNEVLAVCDVDGERLCSDGELGEVDCIVDAKDVDRVLVRTEGKEVEADVLGPEAGEVDGEKTVPGIDAIEELVVGVEVAFLLGPPMTGLALAVGIAILNIAV